MKVPVGWLKEYVDVPVEVARLGADLSLAGLALEGVEGEGDDAVLDLDITTNRVDCMNVYGVAREVSVLYGKPLRPLDVSFSETGSPASEALEIEIEAPDLCPRFCARVFDVRTGPSPEWLRKRLEAVGVRSISNVVDLTNFVMIEMGQPSHAFDLARVPQGKLVVRWGRDGEKLTTLDGADRALTGRIGTVASTEGPLALAGVMGGASSEVTNGTRTVALEAAYWEPLAIRRGARALGMHTEASHRFERGADPEAPPVALARMAHLLEKTGAGTVRPGLIDRAPVARNRRTVILRQPRVKALLGVAVPEAETNRILRGLGFELEPSGDSVAKVAVPTFRGDVAREADLIEEIARHHGLARIPPTLPRATRPGGLTTVQIRERRLREVLLAAGFTEAATYSFVADKAAQVAGGTRAGLANPLAESYDVLRNSLVFPGLMDALGVNLRQGRPDVALFEVGRVFLPAEEGVREELRLGLVASGAFRRRHWSQAGRAADFYDLKGLVEQVARVLGGGRLSWTTEGLPPFVHPGRGALVARPGGPWGYVGVVHPDQAAARELRQETIIGELSLAGLFAEKPVPARFVPLPRFPAVERDLSILCDAALPAEELVAGVTREGGEALRSVTIVDRYDRPPVPAGRVSLTLTLRYQAAERTLTGDEVQKSVERVMIALRTLGAEIRGE